MPPPSFNDFLASLSDLRAAPPVEDVEGRALADALADAVARPPTVSRESVARLIGEHPPWLPMLATSVGLSREQLKNKLRYWFGTSSTGRVAIEHASELVERLDEELGLVSRLENERARAWTYADVLLERYSGSRARASGSISRGRSVEDDVEAIIRAIGLIPRMRTRFVGRNGQTAPCDFAISTAAEEVVIVGCAKGFNSTGSKLTDAVREVERVAEIRMPRQFVFAVIDGIGWLSRQADLRRIHELRMTNQIDGLYTLARLNEFRRDLDDAARLRGLLR